MASVPPQKRNDPSCCHVLSSGVMCVPWASWEAGPAVDLVFRFLGLELCPSLADSRWAMLEVERGWASRRLATIFLLLFSTQW